MPNWCRNDLEVRGPEAEVARFAAAARGRYAWPGEGGTDGEEEVFCLNALYPTPEDVVAKGYEPAGFDWEVANWGVKWGGWYSTVLESSPGRVHYRIDTPWGPPMEFFARVVADWPGLGFYTRRGMVCHFPTDR